MPMFVFLLWIKEAFTGIMRNFWWNSVAVLMALICLLFFAISYISGNTAEQFSERLNQRLEIQVDIAGNNTEYSEIKKEILKDNRISSIEFISKDDAQRNMIKEMGKDSDVLKIFNGENIFPAQFVIKVKNPEDIESVANNLSKSSYFEKVLYGKEYIDKLLKITSKIKKVGYYVTIAGAIFVVLLVVWVIRMNIEQRKDEISIKQLIGASSITIRMPFLIESLLLMWISSLAAYYIFSKLYTTFISYITKELPMSSLTFLDISTVQSQIFLPLFGLAGIIGLLGSVVATTKHLK